MTPPEQHPDADDVVVVDGTVLKALAHPIRTQLLSSLRRQGPGTATALAQRLNLDSGTTSYHLRRLAAAGLIAEDESRGSRRDRWWRAAQQRTVFDSLALADENPDLANAYLHNVVRLNADELIRHVDALPTLPRAWQKASQLNDSALELTPAELTRLMAELDEVVERYRAAHKPGARGAHTVVVQFHGFPRLPLGRQR